MGIRLLLIVALFAQHLRAFTPPAEFISTEMVKRCIATSVNFKGMAQIGGKRYFATFVLSNDELKMTSKTPVVEDSAKVSVGLETVVLPDLAHLISCHNTAKKIIDHLKGKGIDVTVVSQGFNDFDPVFIIGAQPSDSTSPQIWIDKHNFMPVKEINAGRETKYAHWTLLNAISDKRWPATITTTQNGVITKFDFAENIMSSKVTRK